MRLRDLARRLRRRLAGSGGDAGARGSSSEYEVITREEAMAVSSDGWHDPSVAARQDAAFRRLLDAMYRGKPRTDLVVYARAVAATGVHDGTLLEVGCGSGYCSEALAHLEHLALRYTGLDYSSAMIELARRHYPSLDFVVGDACALPFADGAFDVVINGVALMHIPDYVRAIVEARRVARRWCIFHTVPVLAERPTTFLRKRAYGLPAVEVIINEGELLERFREAGLGVPKVFESLPYDLHAELGERTVTRTYLCEVLP
ncbi:MAG: class I SAM-dependent methyltransferase [Bacteroidetes bacterium]|nr:class I SAM-dependent methyltransferase [Bacteroidota bacterium]